MQKTGFPGGEIVMNREEIIKREGEDKRKENLPELKEGIILQTERAHNKFRQH